MLRTKDNQVIIQGIHSLIDDGDCYVDDDDENYT